MRQMGPNGPFRSGGQAECGGWMYLDWSVEKVKFKLIFGSFVLKITFAEN